MGNNIISLTDHILITILNLKCIQIENYVLCSLLKLRCQVNTVNIALLKHNLIDSVNYISDCAVARNPLFMASCCRIVWCRERGDDKLTTPFALCGGRKDE